MDNLKNFVFCLALLVTVKAQRCIPGIVPDITLTSDNELQWTDVLNPANCTITAYVVNIFDLEDGAQFQHQTDPSELSYSLDDLDMCKTYGFEVHALTEQDLIGPSDRINGTIPMTANIDLTVNVNSVALNNNQLTVAWDMLNTAVDRCISYYRVVYWNEDNGPVDVYVATNRFTLEEVPVACMDYSFQVNAILNNPGTEGPVAEIAYSGHTAVPNTPKLVSIDTTGTTVNMTWRVPPYSENRCTLTSLVVSTLGLPEENSTTSIAIQDNSLRANIDVNLQDLIPNTVYISYVHLENIAGSSKNVTVTFQTSDSFVFDYKRDLIYY